ncbi:MAG: Rdx family protein [Deltaproteobacteria bacterium]|nr:Rdx family protein [Deltaproteobacteria bacterium]
MEKATGVEPTLIEGGNGIFDVVLYSDRDGDGDGKLLFSKHDAGRFPETAEILEKLRSEEKR